MKLVIDVKFGLAFEERNEAKEKMSEKMLSVKDSQYLAQQVPPVLWVMQLTNQQNPCLLWEWTALNPAYQFKFQIDRSGISFWTGVSYEQRKDDLEPPVERNEAWEESTKKDASIWMQSLQITLHSKP